MKMHHSDVLWVHNWLMVLGPAFLNPVLGSSWGQTSCGLPLLTSDGACFGTNTGHSCKRWGTPPVISLVLGLPISLEKTFLDLHCSLKTLPSEFLLRNRFQIILSCSEDPPCLLLPFLYPSKSFPKKPYPLNPILTSASWMMWITTSKGKKKPQNNW